MSFIFLLVFFLHLFLFLLFFFSLLAPTLGCHPHWVATHNCSKISSIQFVFKEHLYTFVFIPVSGIYIPSFPFLHTFFPGVFLSAPTLLDWEHLQERKQVSILFIFTPWIYSRVSSCSIRLF